MRNLWRFLRVPTLVRRIMVAQMLLLTLLWCLFLTWMLWDDLRSPPILTGDKTYKTIFTLVEHMEGHTQERSEVLEQFSQALREDYGGGDDAGLSITMIIRKHNAILYASLARRWA